MLLQVDQKLVGMSAWQVGEGGWECPSVAEVLEAVGMLPMKEYISSQQGTIVEYSGSRDQAGPCGGGIRILPGKRRETAPEREQRER